MNTERFAIGLLCALFAVAPVSATEVLDSQPGTQTQEVGKPLSRFSLLKPATHIYLRYKIVDGRRETIDMWRRQGVLMSAMASGGCISSGAGTV
jgi:hypothetical protein